MLSPTRRPTAAAARTQTGCSSPNRTNCPLRQSHQVPNRYLDSPALCTPLEREQLWVGQWDTEWVLEWLAPERATSWASGSSVWALARASAKVSASRWDREWTARRWAL